jgi:glycosyltransferase involved in cell wall biosynthesis
MATSQEHAVPETPIVLCPARLLPVKGHKYLLEAAALLQKQRLHFVLHLAGDGELRNDLERLSKKLGIADRIRFLGHIPHERLIELYQNRRIAVVVLPSLDLGNGEHEGIPVSLMEAMSHGIPVVSTRTGGIPELLEDGAGVLVPPQDARALADAMAQLLSDSKTAREIGSAGRQRVEQEFCVDRIAESLSLRFAA